MLRVVIDGYKPNDILSPEEVATLIGTSVGTVNWWRATGKGPLAVKDTRSTDGRRSIGYRVHDLLDWFNRERPWLKRGLHKQVAA